MIDLSQSLASLSGLTLAPSQCWGGVRLVPLLRDNCPGDLRILGIENSEELTSIAVGKGTYSSYIPHAFVASWDEEGNPAASFGAGMRNKDGERFGTSRRLSRKMAKRGPDNTLRFLPMHLAMEGFLSLHFGGPEIAWNDLSQSLLARGLSPRSESTIPGQWIAGLEQALRIFEIHEDQVGVLCFVADSFASAFVLSYPDDYRALHRTLLDDFFGDLLYQYGLLYPRSAQLQPALPDNTSGDLASLRRGLKDMRSDWSQFGQNLASSLFHRPVQSEKIYKMGAFQLQRFVTDLDSKQENHIGEAILNAKGEIEYLKTYRLSGAQTRRAYLLSVLAKHDWNLSETATFFGQSKEALMCRLSNAGFDYFFKDHIRSAYKPV